MMTLLGSRTKNLLSPPVFVGDRVGDFGTRSNGSRIHLVRVVYLDGDNGVLTRLDIQGHDSELDFRPIGPEEENPASPDRPRRRGR